MKNISSKRAKALAISQKTKRIVYDRDEGLCVICHRPGLPEAHYIPRSKGGLGIEQNVVTMCRDCHRRIDQGDGETMQKLHNMVGVYLQKHYEGWNEEDLVYKKGEEYGIRSHQRDE